MSQQDHSDETTKKQPTSTQREEARQYTKNTKFFERPLQKSSFFQRVGAFFTGRSNELREKDQIIDAIRDKIANNLANSTRWYEAIASSYGKINVSESLKNDFDKTVSNAKKNAMSADKDLGDYSKHFGNIKLDARTQEFNARDQIPNTVKQKDKEVGQGQRT
jgi:hypothetical protein